ncbi:MAG: ATP-binding protein [Lachnospiraceae bacterium]
MKKKINIQLLSIALLAILLTLIMVCVVFYDLFQKQVMSDLESYANFLKGIQKEILIENDFFNQNNDIRISIINSEGTVIFDSDIKIDALDDHSSRPEVIDAFAKGEGESIRKSDTVNKNIFYYAVILEDSYVLRVAKEANNIWSVYFTTIPVILCVALFLFLLCLFVAKFLTKRLISPIEDMVKNLGDVNIEHIYPELIPVIETINNQHQDIIKAAKMRQDFTANVSHELKTPLTSISGYSELIESGMVGEKDIIRFAAEIHKNSTRLLRQINDIIRLSELDALDNDMSFEKVSLYSVARTCVDMLQINAEKHQVSLTFYGEPCDIYATKEMVEEILYNLCDNAIRYNNENGSVHVSVKEIGEEVILTVKDTGIGIPSKHQERIFERFYRVDKSRSKLTGGTGLGLAIVKHILVQIDGDLSLESVEGEGTTVQIIFKKYKESIEKLEELS